MSLNKLLEELKLSRGKIDSVEDVKFLLERSFTPKKIIQHFTLSDDALRYTLARSALENMN